MKITIVMGFFLPMPPAAGGAVEKSWDGLARQFAAAGHEVTILSRRWPGWPDAEEIAGVRYVRLRGDDQTASLPRNLWRDLRWGLRVWCALPAADITILNCIALPVWLGWLRRRAGRVVIMPGRMPKGQYRLYRRIDRVLVVSSIVRDALLAENPGFAPAMKTVGYPIDWTSLARPRAETGTPELVIGYIGRIHREKGLDLFAAALAQLAARPGLPPWRVVICGPADVARGGSGPDYVAGLDRALAAALPRERFEVRAPVFDAAQLGELYRAIDIFCYPSLAARGETFGVAVAEAMAAGAVPVVSSLACFTDFVHAGRNGEVFDHASPTAASELADALARLLADPVRRIRFAQTARADVRRYDFAEFARDLLADFSTLK